MEDIQEFPTVENYLMIVKIIMNLEDCRFHIICLTCEEIYKNGTLFYSEFPENAERVKKNHNKTFKAHNVEIRDKNENNKM